MMRLARLAWGVVLIYAAGLAWGAQSQSEMQPAAAKGAEKAVVLDAGTKVELAVIGPVWAKTAKPGDPLYAQTNFPVTTDNRIAIPAGTYVEGKIEAVARPTRKLGRAELQILFTKIIFANGYTIALPDLAAEAFGTTGQDATLTGMADTGAANASLRATAAKVTVEANLSNDLLLDNGAQIEMTLGAPLGVDARQVATAIPLSRAPEPGKFKSATLCRPTPGYPGSPGTSDTVIPGSPGTPSTTIPGGPGMPDITIPGTPATPDTVIPGTPGTPGTPGSVCPAAPIVISSVPVTINQMPSQNSVPAKSN
jgi:hypothetical protein